MRKSVSRALGSSQVVQTIMFVGCTIISIPMRGELSRSLLKLVERDGSASYPQFTVFASADLEAQRQLAVGFDPAGVESPGVVRLAAESSRSAA